MLKKMLKAGIRWLALGIESSSKHVRDGVVKGRFDNFDIEKKQINLPMGAIKELGIFHANISLHSEVSCDIEIVVEKSEENQESN